MNRDSRSHRRARSAAIMVFALSLLTGESLPPAARSQTGVSRADIQARISREAKLPGGAAYRSLVATRYGTRLRTVPANRTVANASPGSTVVQVGDEPEGFGKTFSWDRKDDNILLAVFINAADSLGVSVEGLQKGDVVQVTSAAGLASFSQDTGNPLASSIVGLVAVGGKALATAEGLPEAAPVIDAGQAFAQDQFKATNAKTKRRDPYGVDPGSGFKALAEGGVLVCLPEAGGPYYSGDGDHPNRRIKPDGTRDDAHLPGHIEPGYAFFPIRGDQPHNTRTVTAGGELYIVPWDWQFDDNAGYYKVFVRIKKGNLDAQRPIILRRPGRP